MRAQHHAKLGDAAWCSRRHPASPSGPNYTASSGHGPLEGEIFIVSAPRLLVARERRKRGFTRCRSLLLPVPEAKAPARCLLELLS